MRQAGARQSMQLKGLVWPTAWPSPYKEESCAGLEGRKLKGLAGWGTVSCEDQALQSQCSSGRKASRGLN